MDWYNVYFEFDLKIMKMDNINYGGNDNVSIINGGFSIIDQIIVDFDGVKVFDLQKINYVFNVKNFIDFFKDYSDKVGGSMFYYFDIVIGVVLQKYIMF